MTAVSENEHQAIGKLFQRKMPNGETHLAHVAGFQPVLGHFFQLLVDERVGCSGSIVTVNTTPH